MVSSAESLSDGHERNRQKFGHEICADLPGFDYLFILLFADEIGFGNLEKRAYGVYNVVCREVFVAFIRGRAFGKSVFRKVERNRLFVQHRREYSLRLSSEVWLFSSRRRAAEPAP